MRILKIDTLPSTNTNPWIDRDYILLHACFQIFMDFVQKEGGELQDPEIQKQLVEWWENHKSDSDDYEEDQRMLELLIKQRSQLWT